MLDEIRELFAYNRWANHRLLEAAARLDDEAFTRHLGGSFPTVRDTLAHIVSAEWIWLARWLGDSPMAAPESWDLATLAGIRAEWEQVERDREAFLAGLDDGALAGIVAYRSMRGEPFAQPLGQLLRHVINHSTYHRGQVASQLRQLGVAVPATDLVLYYRERAAV
jgi:uncharacterized damage-inducible protein DinB